MRRRPLEQDVDEIRTPLINDNQTWNDCPNCGKTWETKPAIPHVIHRTRLCSECLNTHVHTS